MMLTITYCPQHVHSSAIDVHMMQAKPGQYAQQISAETDTCKSMICLVQVCRKLSFNFIITF